MPSWKVLVVGNGAREHALIWKLARSPLVEKVWCAPGNAGTAALAESVPIGANQLSDLVDWAVNRAIDLVVVGPEEPLALGLTDLLTARGIATFGPSAAAARIESSKAWAKTIMGEAGVSTAAYEVFTDADAAWQYARDQTYPLVVKADGLAAGKGVTIAEAPEEARTAIFDALERRKFGDAGRRVMIEEFLTGDELSLLAIADGERAAPLVLSRDHKRIGEGDTGPNTGGMGAIAPTGVAGPRSARQLTNQVIQPILDVLRARGTPYRGVLYAGLINTPSGIKVVEYNCRFGDPETQVVLPASAEDLAELAYCAATSRLPSTELASEPGFRCGVVLASEGYPGPYPIDRPIRGLDQLDPAALAFHGGTRRTGETLVTAGGRVLTIVGSGTTLAEARAHAYANVERVHFEGQTYRRDIGAREIR